MSGWTIVDSKAISASAEVDIAPRRPDGELGPYTAIWVVMAAGDLFARSYRGAAGRWFRAVQRTHRGRIRAPDLERDVILEDIEVVYRRVRAAIDGAYRAKYGRSTYLDAMVTAEAAGTTLRILPG
jgi:hypothetical protein